MSDPYSSPATHSAPPTGPPPAAPPDAREAPEPSEAATRTADEPRTEPPGRSAWRSSLVSAVVAAIVAVGVSVPATFAVIERSGEDTAATANDAAPGEQVGADPSPTANGVAGIAAAASPSVAFVEVIGRQGQGSGSAVIIREDGYLLTNAHVIEGAAEVTVMLADGTRHSAEVVGADDTSDVAVLAIPASGLPAIDIADDVEVGELVVAIGSPFGLEGSVTSGIVSAVDRTIGGRGATLVGLIQTDAAINPGNSGGALVNSEGRLVGINTAIYSATGASAGIGFAIPAATAASVATQLIEGEPVEYAQLGIGGGDVTPSLAAAYGLAVDEGALVATVLPGSGAEAAGLRAGDVITAVDGEPIRSMTQLTATVRGHQPGDELVLEVVRDTRRAEVTVTLGAQR